MARRSILRASDVDRESVAERLRHATAEGRLRTEELEHRLEAVFVARTYGQLDDLTADLPAVTTPAAARRRVRRPSWIPLPIAVFAVLVAVPVVIAVLAAVLLTVVSLLAVWSLLLVAGWWAFGHRRGRYSRPPYGNWRTYAYRYRSDMRRMARDVRRSARGSGAFWA